MEKQNQNQKNIRMTFRTVTQMCRVGHLLAKPTRLTATSHLKSPLLMAQCNRCQLRYQCRDDCKEKPAEKCGDRFKGAACDLKPKATKAVIKQENPKPLAINEQEIKLKRPDICCNNPCKDAAARFDLLYYRRSDKLNRIYQQTWGECPELLKKPKLICRYENIIFPKFEKRPRTQRPQTACKPPTCTNTKTTCPRYIMPRCGKARRPPKCHVNREPLDCVKRKAPFPSFSECRRVLPIPLHPRECTCLALPTMCEVWAYYHKMRAIKKGSTC